MRGVTSDKMHSSITIQSLVPPDELEAFRKWLKSRDVAMFNEAAKESLQAIYDRACRVYDDDRTHRLSRHERCVLYYLQAALFGGLKRETRVRLERMGDTLTRNLERQKRSIAYSLPKAGTIMVKQWKGKRLEVVIRQHGFEYEGEHYNSLSQLAQYIAGYKVSGPIFFGLRKAKEGPVS